MDDLEHISLGETAPGVVDQLYREMDKACAGEVALEKNWMRVGQLIVKCKQTEDWRGKGFESFEKFMQFLRERYQRGKTQLWGYMTVAEHLLPIMPEEQLQAIGISKALEIRRAMAKAERTDVPKELLAQAAAGTISTEQLKAELSRAFNTTPDEKGTWRDTGGFFATKDEWDEWTRAVKMTVKLLNIAPHVPDHIQRKEILLHWAREFYATHAHDVYGPVTAPIIPKLMLPQPTSEESECQPVG